MRTKTIVSLIAALFFSTSCINEPLVHGGGDGGDGTPAPISLSIRSDRFAREQEQQSSEALRTPWAGDTRTVATDETRITELHLLVFDAQGETVTNERFTNLNPADGIYRLKAETLPGNGMQFYIVANADGTGLFAEKLHEQLPNINKLSELQGMLATLVAGNDGLSRTDRLLMVGSATVNIAKPHLTEIPLTLCFLPAKVTVNMIDATDNSHVIDITGWDMVNVPKKSYLAMREASDAVTGTNADDYLTTHEKAPFEHISGEPKTWSHSFYLLENRRGGRVDKTPTTPTDGYPGMGVGDKDQRGKGWYAPAGATYLLVYGTYATDGNQFPVIYKIYLGADNHSDYNVERGKHYTYTVTINGLNQIDIDTTVDWGAASFTVTPSDNLLMDAHPDVRVLRIGGTATDVATPASATVEVLGDAKNWLAVSPLNLYRHAVKQASDNTHQQFTGGDGAGSFVRTRFSTATPNGTFQEATFGMTRKLTGIPFAQPAVSTYQDVMVYADAHTGNGERTGEICITYYKGGTDVAGQQTFTVRQSDAIQLSDNFAMERYEEAGMPLHPGLASGLQRTEVMQWGYADAQLYSADDRFCNGNFLTAHAVYSHVDARNGMNPPQWTANAYADYRPKYPATGSKVIEPSGIVTTGTPYYYPELMEVTQATAYFHPIYNSSAARYCHEKNRDLNGDGIIDQNETVWYLPSYSDMVAIAKNPPMTQPLAGTYWTSTEASADQSWAFTFPGGTAEAMDKTTTNRVRCVRGTGVAMSEPTFESGETDNTKITLSAESNVGGLFRITDDKNFGIEWTVASNADWLKIATDTQGTDAVATKTTTGDAALYAYTSTANPSKEEIRTATLTFTRTAMSITQTKTIEVTQGFTVVILGEKSNSYMLPPGQEISIPVGRANESFLPIDDVTIQLQASTAWTASLVWETSPGLIALSQTTGIGPAGRFNVTATSASAEGNAVVAIKNDKNEILWSWHIWVTKYDGKATFINNNGKRDVVFMDRALGAASATAGELSSCGLMYQWGRKDPFPGIGQQGGSWNRNIMDGTDPIQVYDALGTAKTIPKSIIPSPVINNNLTNATRNPDVFYGGTYPTDDWFVIARSDQNNDLWSGGNITLSIPVAKSVFDPCPAGWRIPFWLDNTNPFGTMDKGSTWGSYGRTWTLDAGGYFPASGYRNAGNGTFGVPGTGGYYWSGAPLGIGGYILNFVSGSVTPAGMDNRAAGLSVRCCKDDL